MHQVTDLKKWDCVATPLGARSSVVVSVLTVLPNAHAARRS
jgi:hypothetical protein